MDTKRGRFPIRLMYANLSSDNDYLKIQLISFDRPKPDIERYYFLEMSTLQATSVINPHTKVISQKISAWTEDQTYFNNEDKLFPEVGDFNDFFIGHAGFYIHDCELVLEKGLELISHDDGEVSIQFPTGGEHSSIIPDIFKMYALDQAIIPTLKAAPGHYFAIGARSKIIADYSDFDDYLARGRQ